MLSIHGRTAKQLSKVPADWNLIQQVREMRDSLSPETKIVGNGDVKNRKNGLELAKKHGLDGIMIGRGIFEDPFAFAEQSPWADFTKDQKIVLFRKHVELFIETYKGEHRRFETLRKFCKIYINNFDGAKELREEVMAADTAENLLAIL